MTVTTKRGRAQVYAEDTLGVNTVHKEVIFIEADLIPLYPRRALLEQKVREYRTLVENIILDFRIEERGVQSELSATAFEAHVKAKLHTLDSLRRAKEILAQFETDLGVLESEIRQLEIRHRSCVARMQELSGYFNYLAASKTASSVGRLIADTVV